MSVNNKSMAPSGCVVGIGELLWDVFPQGKSLGGAPANFAWHVSQFGLDGRVASAVGCDPDGDGILELLGGKSLEAEVARVGHPTGRVEVTLGGEGIPRYDIAEGVAWDNIPWTERLEALAARTGTVCFGTLAQRSPRSRETIGRFLDAMPVGSLKVFDINLRQEYYTSRIISDSLSRADILKINDEELVILSSIFSLHGTEADKCGRLMREFGLSTIILTKGTDGSVVSGAGGEVSCLPTPRVEVADTVGAGDSFTAAYIAAILAGKPLREAHTLAVETSAFVCTCRGAMPVLPGELVRRVR